MATLSPVDQHVSLFAGLMPGGPTAADRVDPQRLHRAGATADERRRQGSGRVSAPPLSQELFALGNHHTGVIAGLWRQAP